MVIPVKKKHRNKKNRNWKESCRNHLPSLKKDNATDAFADAVSKRISKGVLCYTNLPAGASSPRSKRKGRGATQEP
jgi:hypothetical protein